MFDIARAGSALQRPWRDSLPTGTPRSPAGGFCVAASRGPAGGPTNAGVTSAADMSVLRDAACAAVVRAARVVVAARERVIAMGALSKADASPVTIADMAGQAVVARALADRLGPISLIGEETSAALRAGGRSDGAIDPALIGAMTQILSADAEGDWASHGADGIVRALDVGAGREAPSGGFWTLDPIDGTKGFLRGPGGHYCCCLAYIAGGRPVVAAMACPTLDADRPLDEPARGVLLWAHAGGGAWMRGLFEEGPARRMFCASWGSSVNGGALRMVASVEPEWASLDRAVPLVRSAGFEPTPVRMDSQCKYAMVALGRADLFLRLPKRRESPDYIWDHASGDLIARESGAAVTDSRGRDLDFSHGQSLEGNAGFLAAPAGLHGQIRAALDRAGV